VKSLRRYRPCLAGATPKHLATAVVPSRNPFDKVHAHSAGRGRALVLIHACRFSIIEKILQKAWVHACAKPNEGAVIAFLLDDAVNPAGRM
jgi:hypothetical protein